MINALLITWAIYFGVMGVFVLPAVLRPDKVRLESAWWDRAITAFDYGLAEAKDLLNQMKRSKEKYTLDFEVPALKQAIADYEEIYPK